jgi:hypothetical protein
MTFPSVLKSLVPITNVRYRYDIPSIEGSCGANDTLIHEIAVDQHGSG